MPYERFRIGGKDLFTEVRQALAIEQRQVREAGDYKYVRRGGVLGRMHEMKQAAYAEYVADWYAARGLPVPRPETPEWLREMRQMQREMRRTG